MKHPRRIRPALRLLAAALLGAAPAAAAQPAHPDTAVRTRLILRTFTDFGHIVHGSNTDPRPGSPAEISMQPLNRANFLAIQEVASGNFDVAAGLSGLIWWPYGGGITDANERVMNVKPMVPVARARWRFGDPAGTAAALLVGTFNHKYNPDARNLGEYLYRSGTYPGFLWTTEGWLLMNRAASYSHGALLNLAQLNGALKHNFTLFMETNYYPVGDFSPGYDVSFAGKWFEAGAGAVLHHYLPLRPSTLRPRNDANTLVIAEDTVTGERYEGPLDRLDLFSPDVETRVVHRWTHKGIKLMGRGALNLNRLLPPDSRGPEDLRVFAEVAVLGLEDQPLFYENRGERIPVMFGVNLPTFRLLDVLSVQGELYRSRFNDIALYNSASLPQWGSSIRMDGAGGIVKDANGRVRLTSVREDDWKWSVYAKKTVNKAMTVYTQAASDHLRLTDGKFNPSNVPLTASPSEWYYLVRLEFTLR